MPSPRDNTKHDCRYFPVGMQIVPAAADEVVMS